MAFGDLKGTLTGNGNSIAASNSIAGSVVVNVGDLVFAVIGEQTSLTATAATDNLGNTYTAQNAGTLSSTVVSGRAFWSRITVPGTLTSVAVAATSSTHDWAGFATVLQGPFATSPLDTNPANITTDITSPFACPATGTLAQANEAVVAWGVANQSTAWAATAPNLLSGNSNNTTNVKVAIGTQPVSATTTVTPNFTAAANPTNDVLGTASFKQDPPFPNGWQRAADNIKAAVAIWPMLLLATQATTFAAPAPTLPNSILGMGWYQQLSSSAPVANQAKHTQATTFAAPAPASNTVSNVAWQQPLSVSTPVAKTVRHQSVVPFNTAQVARTTPSGWQSTQSSAPARAVINGSGLTFVVAPFAVPGGWQSQLSPAPPVAKAQQGLSVVPFNTAQITPAPPQGWQQQLSTPVAVAKAQAGSTSVPLNTAQRVTTPPNGWFGPVSTAAKTTVAQSTQATTFAVPPQVVTVSQFGWHSPLSKSVPVASAKQGSTFVPFNTAQITATVVPTGWLSSATSIAKTAVAKPTQATNFSIPPQPARTPGQFGWYQQLSKPVSVAVAQQGNTSVPFDTVQRFFSTVQTVPSIQDASATTATNVYYQSQFNPLRPITQVSNTTANLTWQQPLSVAVKSSIAAQPGLTFVPLNTAQTVPSAPQGWWQPLSKSVPVAQAQQGSAFVPLNTVQVTTSPQGWWQQLSVAPKLTTVALQGTILTPLSPTAVPFTGWLQPLSVAAKSSPVNHTQPVWTPTAFQSLSLAWAQPLSTAVATTQVQTGSISLPFPVTQPTPISGMAWFTPLGTVATTIPTASQGMTFVPFDTPQVTPPPPPPSTQPDWKPFLSTVGRLSCIG